MRPRIITEDAFLCHILVSHRLFNALCGLLPF